jgi:hypothetical protein
VARLIRGYRFFKRNTACHLDLHLEDNDSLHPPTWLHGVITQIPVTSTLSLKASTLRRDISEATPPARWLLALLIFDLEDGGDTFLRNVGSHTDYTALCPRRWHHSMKDQSITETLNCVHKRMPGVGDAALELHHEMARYVHKTC